MNQDPIEIGAEAEVKAKASPLNRGLVLVFGVITVVVAGSLLIFLQADSAAGCAGEGPCMLFFSADW